MKKALIIYGTATGNTEAAALTIGGILTGNGAVTTLVNCADADPDLLTGDHDMILFGCSTVKDEEIELQKEFIPFYDASRNFPLSKKKVAVFGCGDGKCPFFCDAVDELRRKAADGGADLVASPLKIDGDPRCAHEKICAWAQSLVQ